MLRTENMQVISRCLIEVDNPMVGVSEQDKLDM